LLQLRQLQEGVWPARIGHAQLLVEDAVTRTLKAWGPVYSLVSVSVLRGDFQSYTIAKTSDYFKSVYGHFSSMLLVLLSAVLILLLTLFLTRGIRQSASSGIRISTINRTDSENSCEDLNELLTEDPIFPESRLLDVAAASPSAFDSIRDSKSVALEQTLDAESFGSEMSSKSVKLISEQVSSALSSQVITDPPSNGSRHENTEKTVGDVKENP